MGQGNPEIRISVVLHCNVQNLADHSFERTFQSVLRQNYPPIEIIVLNQSAQDNLPVAGNGVPVKNLKEQHATLGAALSAAINVASGEYILYLDNQSNEIRLKRGYLDVATLMIEKYPRLGLFYADYDLIDGDQVKEIRLLKHHYGRLRDNQDFGKVWLITKAAWNGLGSLDTHLKYKFLYDLRLRISEKFEVQHVANRNGGGLYEVVAETQKHNVFDYLLAGKEAQLEAEAVLTNHLKRIGAYLKPGVGYHKRPGLQEHYDYVASVIIPVNNRPEFIGVALESVLAQTVSSIEAIVVVNGGETDPTIDEVRRFLPGGERYQPDRPPVRLIVTDINNIGFSLNLGVKHARGRYYVQLDSDDRLKPDAVAKIVAVFDSDEYIGAVIGSYEVWEKKPDGKLERMESIPVVTHAEWTEENGRNNLLHINGAGAPRAIPIKIIKEMGYFGINDEPYARNYGEDYDLILKISERYRIGRVWEPIYEVVRHAGGTDHSIDQATIDRNDEAKDYMRLLAVQRRILINHSK